MTLEVLAQTLAERGKHYAGPGGYADTARTSQILKRVFRESPNWAEGFLNVEMKESLDMIANKLARLLNGNAHHTDSWHDLAGYSTLAEKSIKS